MGMVLWIDAKDRYGIALPADKDGLDGEAMVPPVEAGVSRTGRSLSLYSTVTLLAKLRGWSTSVPLATATW